MFFRIQYLNHIKISIRNTGLLLFALGLQSFVIQAQFEDFNPSPYTVESTYLKLKEAYPEVNYPKLRLNSTVEVKRNLHYGSTGPVSKTLDLFLPTTENTPPLILLIHGGGWVSGSKANLEDLAVGLVNKGFAVANMEYAKSTEAPYPASVVDIKNALAFIDRSAATFGYNGAQKVLLGCSAGAQLASLVALSSGSKKFGETDKADVKVQGLINVDGILSFTHPESEEGVYAAYWLGGFQETHQAVWEEASPLNYVGKDTPPTLFINSAQPRFHAGRDDMITLMRAFDIPFQVHTFEASPHSFWLLSPWFEPTVELIHQFVTTLFHDKTATD